MTDQNADRESRPKPFSKERTKAVVSKVIYLYSLFFVILKVMAVFKGADLLPHFIIAIPFLIFTVIGIYLERKHTYSWIYVILGIIVISAIRYFETDLLQYFQETLI